MFDPQSLQLGFSKSSASTSTLVDAPQMLQVNV
jgi:hypothetical protein